MGVATGHTPIVGSYGFIGRTLSGRGPELTAPGNLPTSARRVGLWAWLTRPRLLTPRPAPGMTGILLCAAGLPVCLTRAPKPILHPPPVSKSDVKPVPGVPGVCRKTKKKHLKKSTPSTALGPLNPDVRLGLATLPATPRIIPFPPQPIFDACPLQCPQRPLTSDP